jgi:hypothetical protein
MGSSKRRRGGASRGRDKRRDAQARETRAAQVRAQERKQLTLRAYRFHRALGWSLIGFGILVGASHWLSHIQLWASPRRG